VGSRVGCYKLVLVTFGVHSEESFRYSSVI
jgi:hypothetical protein